MRTAGGNPLALRELPRSLSAEQLGGQAPLPQPLPAGTGIEAAFMRRVAGLPDDTRRALLVASAMQTRQADLLFAALARMGTPAEAVDPAVAADVATLRGGEIDLVHPLLRSAVYHDAAPSDRRAAHAALAEVLAPPLAAPRVASRAGRPRARRGDRRRARGRRPRGAQPRWARRSRACLPACRRLTTADGPRAPRCWRRPTDESAVGHAEHALD